MKKIIENYRNKITEKHLFKLVNIKNYFSIHGFRKYYYSQSGEDIIANKLLPHKNGFYVDVGAYHPKHYSNTYLLYKKRWRGINIDPSNDSIKLFKKERSRDINLRYGISTRGEDLTYYSFSHPSCNTFSKEQADKMSNKKWIKLLKTEKIGCLPLKEILSKHLPKNQSIDLLNVDVEGLDMEVLLSNDWDNYQPKVIIIESPEFNPKNSSDNNIFKFLTEKNYRLHAFTGLSLIFVINE